MLTDEQINNLNIGDTLILNNYPVSYVCVYPDGIIDATDDKAEECCKTACFFPLKYLSLPPKHDPCRLFKNGDRVTPKEVNGRHPGNRGAIFTVRQDEAESGRNILLTLDGHIGSITIDAAYLELITPVEEMMPYSIGKSDYNGFVNIEKKGKIIAMIPYGKELHEHKTEEEALAAAEAERDRLNAEWRKEMLAAAQEEEEEEEEDEDDDKKW